ncbi:MAG: four helix bundle suffix domain-containing protein, partial [bacterium]
AEGSQVSGTSKKMEIKLTSVARASLEELRLDYEDFLRQRGLPLWKKDDPRRKDLVARRCATVDEVAAWVRAVHGKYGRDGHDGRVGKSIEPTQSTSSVKSSCPEVAANASLVLIGVAAALLDRHVAAQCASFEAEGGFTERLYRTRRNGRGNVRTP